MNDLQLKVYDKVSNQIFPVSQIFFNNEGVKTVRIIGKAPSMADAKKTSWTRSMPINQLVRKRIELLLPTGCEDKNGKQIYLGDLLTDGLFILEVTFSNGCFWCGNDTPLWDIVNEDRYEIMRNAFIVPTETELVNG